MKFFYTEKQTAANVGSFSPSALKPKKLLEYLSYRGHSVEVVEPIAVTLEDLHRAHDPRYVDDVLALRELNGFDNNDPAVAASLPFTSGSLLSAARAALAGEAVVCSPTSGFHHAGYDHGGGFCTFNGLMVAALHLRHHRLVDRLAIIDCDVHFGDGTEDIATKKSCYDWCFTTGALLRPHRGAAYLDALALLVKNALEFQPQLILYQAGADVHVHDPLGGCLTTEEMARRDRLVFGAALRAGIPLVWNLAGGYQKGGWGDLEPVLELHLQTYLIAEELLGAATGTERAPESVQ